MALKPRVQIIRALLHFIQNIDRREEPAVRDAPLDPSPEVRKMVDRVTLLPCCDQRACVDVQIAAGQVLAQFPRLVGDRKLRTSADPFVIALAQVEGWIIITEEKFTGSPARPNIPDVCRDLRTSTIDLLQLIRIENWIVG